MIKKLLLFPVVLLAMIGELAFAVVMSLLLIGTMGLVIGLGKLFGEFFGAPLWFTIISSIIGLLYGILVLTLTAIAGPPNET